MFAELLNKGHFISSKLCLQEYLTQCWIAPATCWDPAPCLGEDGGVERKAFCLSSFAVDKLLPLHTLFTFFCPVQTTCHQHTRNSGQKYDYTITLHTAEWSMNTEVRSWTMPVHLTLHITRNLTRCQYSLYTQAESVSLYDKLIPVSAKLTNKTDVPTQTWQSNCIGSCRSVGKTEIGIQPGPGKLPSPQMRWFSRVFFDDIP